MMIRNVFEDEFNIGYNSKSFNIMRLLFIIGKMLLFVYLLKLVFLLF